MIAVDTSAIMAILLQEPSLDDCASILSASSRTLISAGTLAEVHITATMRGLDTELNTLLERMKFEIVPVTADVSKRMGKIYSRWGKRIHRASLNFGDCFAYDVAKQNDCPLLFIGNDFSQTDIKSAL